MFSSSIWPTYRAWIRLIIEVLSGLCRIRIDQISLRGPAAVDDERRPGDVPRPLAREEASDGGDLLDGAAASERNQRSDEIDVRAHAPHRRGRVGGEDRFRVRTQPGLDRSRADRVDGDRVLGADGRGELPRQSNDPVLGRDVRASPAAADGPGP